MYIRFCALLLPWLIPVFRSIHALAATESIYQTSRVGTPWLSYSGIRTSGWQDQDDTLSDATAAFLNSSVTSVNADQVATNSLKPSTKAIAEEFGSSGTNKASFPGFASRRLAIALALLFFAGLLTVGLKRPAAPAHPALSAAEQRGDEEMVADFKMSDDESITEARACLEKVKGLLPAASRLASAVGSAESEKLMAEVQQVIARATEVTMNGQELDGSITVALEALQKLQQTAIDGAMAIERADSSSSASSSLLPLLETITAFGHDTEQETMQSYITTLKSLHEVDICLNQRFAEVTKRISAQGPFENETHGERLLVTALAMEELQEISASRWRLASVKGELSEAAVNAIKGLLLAERRIALREIEGCRDVWRVRVFLEKNSEKTALSSIGENALTVIEEALKGINGLMDKLLPYTQAVETSTTLEASITAGRKAEILEREARKLLMKCASAASSLPAVSGLINGADRELIVDTAMKADDRMWLDNLDMLFVLQKVRETLKEKEGNKLSDAPQYVNAALKRGLMAKVTELEMEAEKRVTNPSLLPSVLKSREPAESALEFLERTNVGMAIQSEDKRTAELLNLDASLLVFLENDLSATVGEISRMLSKRFPLSDTAKARYGKAQGQFNAATKAAKTASTVLEAAQKAAELRFQALAIQALLFSSEQKASGF